MTVTVDPLDDQIPPPPANEMERIAATPEIQAALDLFQIFGSRKWDKAGLDAFLDTLPEQGGPERAKLDNILNNVSEEPDLSTREGQLVWAAGLAYATLAVPGGVRNQKIWRALVENPHMAGSLGSTARYVDLSVTNRNATMDWGTPGSWFFFDPDKNHINIDLFHTLLTGFDEPKHPAIRPLAHATGVMMHEIGHAELTTRFTDRMQVLRDREIALVEEAKTRKLTKEEFAELKIVRKEFTLRIDLFNAAEDDCVNRYAANTGRDFPHDFGASLNVCNVLLQGSGKRLRTPVSPNDPVPTTDVEKARDALNKLSNALALAFYGTNGLFNINDAETWKKMGIDPDQIRQAGTTQTPNVADSFFGQETDFQKLMRLAVGPGGIASQQPSRRDRWQLRNIFARSVGNYADRRCKIMDEIWDCYAAPHAQVLLNELEQETKDELDQKSQPQNQGQSQNDSDNDPSPDSGEPSKDGSPSSSGEPGDNEGSGGSGQDTQNPGTGSGGGQSDQTSGQGNQAADDATGGGGDTGEEQTNIDVEGAGQMDSGKKLPATPEEMRRIMREMLDGEPADPAEPDPKTVRELAQEARQQDRQADGPNGGSGGGGQNDQPIDPDLDMDSHANVGGREKGLDLASLARGDWSEFRQRMNELNPVITRVSDTFVYVRERQTQTIRSISPHQREMLPRGGELRQRMDMRAHMNLAVKRNTGQKIEETDLRRWKMDTVDTQSPSVELWILIDGSASMKESLPGGGRRIDSAVQSSAILYESGRRASFDTFVGMWGDDTIRLVAQPGDSDQSIGDNFQRIRDGINSGTQLSPSFKQSIDHSARLDIAAGGKPRRFAGMSHFLIISDGELNHDDIKPTIDAITALFRFGPSVSVDIAKLGNGAGGEMRQVVDGVLKNIPGAQIALIQGGSAREIPVQLSDVIKARFERSLGDIRAVPDALKREAFARAHKVIRL